MARRRRQRKDWDKTRGVILAIIGLLLIAGLGGGWYWATNKQTKIDIVTNCPTSGPTAIHAILIDRSDPITPLQAQQVRQIVDRYVKEAKIGERFDLFVANSDAVNVLAPVASVCSPGRGDQASELYQNPAMIQRQFDGKFVSVLRSNLEGLLVTSTSDSSPILESIRAVAVASFGNVDAGSIPLELTIVSDFVQSSPAISHFRGETNFDELAKKPAWRQLQANLKGAKVHALYLNRKEAARIQNRGHQLFWEKALRANGSGEIDFSVL